MRIRAASHDDWREWWALWQRYCSFYEVNPPLRVMEATWQKILTPGAAVQGLVAEGADGRLIGFCNYVLHPNTWSDQLVCYLEDLFVEEGARRQGVATTLIEQLVALGRRENWFRLYWLTNTDNHAARAAYDRLAGETGHVRYEVVL